MEDVADLFAEPEGFRPASPSKTCVEVKLESLVQPIVLDLVGNHPLWGHHLWNAAKVLVQYLQDHRSLVDGSHVLELGAGAGLPGIYCALSGARRTVLTDYPDQPLIDNLRHNVERNCSHALVETKGYIWGRSVDSLFESSTQLPVPVGFDLVILSDLIFNHSQHEALLQTCAEAIVNAAKPAKILVFYTSHRPHLAHKDVAFFDLARQKGWKVEPVVQAKPGVMFEEDSGDIDVRSTVHGYSLTSESNLT